MEQQYSGIDTLDALEIAHNYNHYLTRLIRESTESKDLINFGAGIEDVLQIVADDCHVRRSSKVKPGKLS
jgi:hypothetical protein